MYTLIDRGGTFTDVVYVADDGTVTFRKIRSDDAVIGELAKGPLRFGTTVATNALLERTGVPTLALLTEGLEQLPWLGDMRRPRLFDPDAHPMQPLCERSVGVPGRLDAEGIEVHPLEFPDPAVLDGVSAVAIALMHSHRNPAHEQALAAWVRQHRPDLFIAMGHRISPERGYLARVQTTLVHAAITPVLDRALQRDRVPAGALAIRSDGSLCDVEQLIAPDAVLSGPAGGVLAVAEVARLSGFQRAVGLDMGGTSTDVCRIDTVLPRRHGDVTVAGIPLRRPMLAIDTIASGGGSICWTDGEHTGVGPRSAGATPGPQCYGAGGPPTLTDAALIEGLLDPKAFDPPLDPSAVSLPGPAAGFLEIARERMAAAVRKLAQRDGADLRDHALVAFGGAAGQHAAGVAERLGIDTVLVHPAASVLSAWGQTLARREAYAVRDLDLPLSNREALELVVQELCSSLPDFPEREVTLHLHHEGTDGVLAIALEPEPLASFHQAHLERFGFQRSTPVRVRSVHVRVQQPRCLAPPPPPFPLPGPIAGPTVLHSPTTSVWVPSGWTAHLEHGLLRLDRQHPTKRLEAARRTPVGVALWSSRFMAAAEAGGEALRRTARSVNIRERLDFSCAVFDSAGELVANAPHIPVHLGAMGATVRSLIAHRDPSPDTHWLCNDPGAGGSHLPDLTVVSVAELGGRAIYVASRAHHVDVGGSTPGSMPPHSSTLAEEGMVFTHEPLSLDGSGPDLSGSREPATVQLDLAAQIAANRAMLRALGNLGAPGLVHTWMAHTLDATEHRVRARIAELPAASEIVRDTLRGIPLQLQIRREGDGLTVDFDGTGGPDAGNLNAPSAVVRAAVLYGLRVLLDTDLPLNEGALRAVRICVPDGSVLDAPAGAAVAGGNVETSQRVADLFLRAAGRCAASGGTMNNLTLGGAEWSYYETLGSGQGGSARGAGLSGRQVHMTNTAATDPEVLEARLPLRIWSFSRRPRSGGEGEQPGGDGLIRELEVCEPTTVCLLATRRDSGAPGLGGATGRPGEDYLLRDGRWILWNGAPTSLEPGDRVRVATPGGGGFTPSS